MSGESARQLLREASLELARLRRVRGAYRTTWRRIAKARARLAFAAALLAAPLAEPAAAVAPHFRHGFIFARGVAAAQVIPAFADIDGDGDVDVFVGAAGSLFFAANTGTATQTKFAELVENPFGLVSSGMDAAPTAADLDGDFDLLVGTTVGTLYFENTGTATAPAFAAPQTNAFGLSVPFFDLADLDADGDLDAFSVYGSFHQNTGSATAPAFAAGVPNAFGLTAVGDTEFADDLDAFVGSFDYFNRTLTLFENTGSASAPAFAPLVSNPLGLIGVGYDSFSDFADVDGDGGLDALLFGQRGESTLVVEFENTGSATAPAFTNLGNPFGLGKPYSYYSAASAPAFADIDGDGDLDAYVSESVTRSISFFQNTGSASAPAFAPPAAAPRCSASSRTSSTSTPMATSMRSACPAPRPGSP
jgi:hypothetical protein